MKKIYILALLLLFAFISCKKDSGSPTSPGDGNNQPTTPPSVPVHVVPANNSTGISVQGLFSWYASQGASSYTVEVASDSLFKSKVFTQANVKASTLRMSGLSVLTKYFWHVQAVNAAGASDFSSLWTFTTADSISSYASVNGKITDVNELPLSGVKVYTSPATATVYSDTNGNYIIKNVVGGSYTLYAEKDGYVNYSVTLYMEQGVAYGQNITLILVGSVSTCVGIPTVTYGGKTYHTVQIGNQCWLQENINIGSMILGSNNQTNNGTIEKYCYDNDTANCTTYGGLYQWREAIGYADTGLVQGICPTGWHIPTKSEFQALVVVANNNSRALRAVGEGAGTNTTGFSALLGGYRFTSGTFSTIHEHATFWSSTIYSGTDYYYMGLRIGDNTVDVGAGAYNNGFSVRCVKNQ